MFWWRNSPTFKEVDWPDNGPLITPEAPSTHRVEVILHVTHCFSNLSWPPTEDVQTEGSVKIAGSTGWNLFCSWCSLKRIGFHFGPNIYIKHFLTWTKTWAEGFRKGLRLVCRKYPEHCFSHKEVSHANWTVTNMFFAGGWFLAWKSFLDLFSTNL